MMTRFCDLVTKVARFVMWTGVAAMIVTVGLQVVARNILQTPIIWTSDVAQLLFTWLTFIGAAVGLRMGAHYRVDLLPQNLGMSGRVIDLFGFIASIAVAYILLRYGWELAVMRKTASIQSLSISRFWFFLSMPVSGVLMLLFLAEILIKTIHTSRSGESL